LSTLVSEASSRGIRSLKEGTDCLGTILPFLLLVCISLCFLFGITSVSSRHISAGRGHLQGVRFGLYDMISTTKICRIPHISHDGQILRSSFFYALSSPIYLSRSMWSFGIAHLSLQSHDTSSPNQKRAHQRSPRSIPSTPPRAGTNTPCSHHSARGSARSSQLAPADPEARGTEGCPADQCTRGT
jgi:hypothetical protein